MTNLSTLTRLCPPPRSQPASINWDHVETELGMRLPEDYKLLASTYGPGRFADYIGVQHPHGVTPYSTLTGPRPSQVRAYLQDDYDHSTYPAPYDPQHLFLIGSTDNGEYLFWITDPEDAPDTWHIAVNEARGPQWFTYDGTLTAFLTSVLTGTIRVPQFPDTLLDQPVRFVPAAPPSHEIRETPTRGSIDTETIRNWARANGFSVPPAGRIPREVREAWEQAHPV
ncbi:SMI1/KNR4 family protein [Streptomyces sp. XY413]|uniref:Lsr2 family DNA-binding protein n=1 Tax=Streptomyces sp. XY413 TaxID=1519479 RepID=UPI00099B952C|nr:histone-like nucleoid-structuring protein Lsr2 [Streptomyces sp. XY413]